MDITTRRTPDLDRALDAWEGKIQSGCEQIEDWTAAAAEYRDSGDLDDAAELEAQAAELQRRVSRWARLQDATWRRMRRVA